MRRRKPLASYSRFHSLARWSTAGLLGLGALPTVAALEEVIVTAQKKSENLQQVAVAVSAFSEDTIRNTGILDIGDVTAQTPGFSISSYNPTTPAPYVRGVGTNSSSVGDDASVGVFIDEVYAGRAGGYSTDMFDVQRIEVLRGPQGTLYGRNVAGGAMNVITNKPSDVLEGRAEVTAGNYDLLAINAMLSGPLSADGGVRGRIAVSSRERDGWVDNVVTGNELKNEDNISARAKLAFDLGDRAELLLSADYGKDDDLRGPAARSTINVAPPFPGEPNDKVSLDFDGFTERELYGTSATLNWDLGPGTLTSITAYRANDYSFLDDLTGTWPVLSLTNDATEESSQFSQEFRYAAEMERFGYTVGAYYFDEEVDRLESFDSSGTIGIPGASRPLWDASMDSTSASLFGEATWYLSERLSLIAGGRFTWDEKEFSNVTSNPDILGYLLEAYTVEEKETWSQFTPKLGVEFQLNNDVMLYATWAEGYKAGGYNGLAATLAEAQKPFDQELVSSFEAGVKSDLLDQTLRINANVFYSDYQDLQNFFVDVETSEVITATADAQMQGLELEIWWTPVDRLDIFLAASVMDTEYTKFPANPAVEGNKLMRAPDSSGSLGIQYAQPIGDMGDLLLRTDVTYTDEMYFSTANVIESGADSYSLVNARAALRMYNGWEFALWGKNLADEDYVVHSFTAGLGDGHPIYGNPTMWGVTASYAF
ncbi:TonB-dependent receptor [Seongchinamella sediminis]|uniref:TonB-dependent receptor n=1 Tax=Seongchinamella sediminis TaxID=2283635 RepID=A0A3L7DU63_9GAMM|nr:TonB-dependent receptor [Seongchinamella sediminis]RLQ20646.1 TonB-dependent receptor [Seongchinamella sediminis]